MTNLYYRKDGEILSVDGDAWIGPLGRDEFQDPLPDGFTVDEEGAFVLISKRGQRVTTLSRVGAQRLANAIAREAQRTPGGTIDHLDRKAKR